MSSSNTNVVPLASQVPVARGQGTMMPMTTTTTPPPLPWPYPPGGIPGCAPPGCPPSSLMQCYCDVQNASAFISAIMIDAINNNPAVTQAIIAAIEASGSNLPLIGVTNGADAQPGQVGEWVLLEQIVNYPVTLGFNQTVTMGIIQPGDWDLWIYANCPNPLTSINITISPAPVGLFGVPQQISVSPGPAEPTVANAPTARLLCSVPTLIPVLVVTNQSTAGSVASTLSLFLSARRRR